MNPTVTSIAVAACLAAPLILAPAARAQGALTPPGAPAPTLRTLAQVEPRFPISGAGITISQPGSYYLTTNLTCTGHGVVIAASGVTLDLMGFSLTGDRGTSDYGVFIDGSPSAPLGEVVVRNGSVRGFGQGLRAEYCRNSRLEQLNTTTNVSFGLILFGEGSLCDGNAVLGCTASDNSSHGIYLDGGSGSCDGNRVEGCTVTGNKEVGVLLAADSGECNDNRIAACVIGGNKSYGLSLNGEFGQCNGNSVSECVISGNSDDGIVLNGFSGECAHNAVIGCTIQRNATYGMFVTKATGNRVEGNLICDQLGSSTIGIHCTGSARNLFLRNVAVNQTNNFNFVGDDTYGPIVTNTGPLSTTGAQAHPWANFSR